LARDFQHAIGRAVLQGQIECARWLLANGARMEPGTVMGARETLDADGIRFAPEMNVPSTDEHGDRLAPLAMVLETYRGTSRESTRFLRSSRNAAIYLRTRR